jgi:hypothetical protein
MMGETFAIIAKYRNQERSFDAELRVFGYSYKIAVLVDGVEIIFEPDEEKNYRAILPGGLPVQNPADTGLLQAIAEALESSLK